MTCHHPSAPLHLCSKSTCLFAPLLSALCSVAKFCHFYDWLEFHQNLGWVLKHSSKWRHFATTLMKPGDCSVSSDLWIKPVWLSILNQTSNTWKCFPVHAQSYSHPLGLSDMLDTLDMHLTHSFVFLEGKYFWIFFILFICTSRLAPTSRNIHTLKQLTSCHPLTDR